MCKTNVELSLLVTKLFLHTSPAHENRRSIAAREHIVSSNMNVYLVFFAAAALAFAAFFRLLLIMTIPKKDPTTAEPNNVSITGIRMAQTRGGKRLWSG